MHIILKNKFLIYNDYKLKCAIGKRGIGIKKREGDLITPSGIYKIKYIFYRPDKIKNLKTKFRKKTINKKMGWCDDPKSKKYNKLVKINKKINYSYEKMYRKDYKYDLLIPILYNYFHTKKNYGSAIFIHLTRNYSPTVGCIGLIDKDFKILLKLIKKNSKIKIQN